MIAQRENGSNKRLLTIPELAEYTGTKTSYPYEQSRHNALAGLHRIGKFVSVDIDEFLNYGADAPRIDQELIEDVPLDFDDLISSLWPFSEKRDLPEGILTQLYLDGKNAEQAIDQIVFSKKKHDFWWHNSGAKDGKTN